MSLRSCDHLVQGGLAAVLSISVSGVSLKVVIQSRVPITRKNKKSSLVLPRASAKLGVVYY